MKMTDEIKKAQCEKNLYDYLRDYARKNPKKPYLITDDRTIDYGEALMLAEQTAARLMECGVEKGDLVALRAERCPSAALLAISLCVFGGIAVMTDAHFRADEYIGQTGVGIEPDFYLTSEDGSDGKWMLKDGDYSDICDITPADFGLDVSAVVSAHDLEAFFQNGSCIPVRKIQYHVICRKKGQRQYH